ncbi:peritrophin-1-like [Stegodyphus dumicola]|uniref:peritrophin-1-like n=1 Tax=Stegodyphus dumicola TaxID=202533 RepID=UPI0015AFFFDE|nr:peritrophin-1-like [Stegodyphus dumicola]XP_035213230.1 peritrophin-1-like [Stegodyphus dumicola]
MANTLFFFAVLTAVVLPFFNSFAKFVTEDSSWAPDCPEEKGKIPRMLPHPKDCRRLFICYKEVAKQYFCPKDQVFSVEDQECKKEGSCSKDYTKFTEFDSCPCPSGAFAVHLPHPTDCTMYYICDHCFAYLRKCPDDLHFNPGLEVCDFPYRANCKARFLKSTLEDS